MSKLVYLQSHRSAHVKVDEFVERTEEESKKELEDYKRFVSIEIDTFPDTSVNKEIASTEPSIVIKLQEVQTESQGPKSQSEATELEQLEPKVESQEDNNAIHSRVKELVLKKYVRRHHAPNQIIGNKLEGTMTRSKLKGTCLLVDFEPRNVKDALENESWIKVANSGML